MKTGIFITARTGSTRLRNKHFLPCAGQPILNFLIQRIQKKFQNELASGSVGIFITTGPKNENHAFETFQPLGVQIFYGSNDNIPYRHLQAIRANKLNQAIIVDGDDILCSATAMKKVLEGFVKEHHLVKSTNLPLGMNVMGYTQKTLSQALAGKETVPLETGWGRIFKDLPALEIPFKKNEYHDELRFTLDYPEDYAFFEKVIKNFGEKIVDASDEAIIDCVIKNNFYKINSFLQNQYWENFKSEINKETTKA